MERGGRRVSRADQIHPLSRQIAPRYTPSVLAVSSLEDIAGVRALAHQRVEFRNRKRDSPELAREFLRAQAQEVRPRKRSEHGSAAAAAREGK